MFRHLACYHAHMALALLGHTTLDQIDAIRSGLPYRLFEDLAAELQVRQAELAHTLGVPARTLQRRKQEGVFTPEESDRLFRVARLVERSKEVIGADGPRWLTTPKRALNGATPLQVADTEVGAWELFQLLGRLEHGVFL